MSFTITEKITDNFEELDDVNGDGTLWECIYDIENPQCEFIELLFEYVKDASANFTIQVAFSDIKDTVDSTFFKETVMDPSLLTIKKAEFTNDVEDDLRLIYPVGKASDKVKFIIVPDVATGSDTLKLICNELTPKGRGGR